MKIIGSDYDGTLNHNGIDDKKKSALKAWHDAGNIFAIVSGRERNSLLRLYNEKNICCDYLIANNGAVIMKSDGTVTDDLRCDGELIEPLFRLLFENGCHEGWIQSTETHFVFVDPSFFNEEVSYTLESLPEIESFNQISTHLPTLEDAERVASLVKERFAGKLNPLQNGSYIDIVRADVNKAAGLYLLMDHLGAEYGDVIAVGDNINDSDMIREFKSYAMESGYDVIKELADYVTPGITELIERELGL